MYRLSLTMDPTVYGTLCQSSSNMSGVTDQSAKLSLRERLFEPLRHKRHASLLPASPSLSSHPSSSLLHSPATTNQDVNLSNASATSSSLHQATSTPINTNDLLAHALQQLSKCDRTTIQDHILPDSSDIDSALKQALVAAKEKQQCCLENRWTFII